MKQRLQAKVTGTVQGVAFRHYALREATRLGLVGTVANHPDGSVQLIAEGDLDALRELAAWATEGSPAAEVDEVEVRYVDGSGEFDGFSIIRYGEF